MPSEQYLDPEGSGLRMNSSRDYMTFADIRRVLASSGFFPQLPLLEDTRARFWRFAGVVDPRHRFLDWRFLNRENKQKKTQKGMEPVMKPIRSMSTQ